MSEKRVIQLNEEILLNIITNLYSSGSLSENNEGMLLNIETKNIKLTMKRDCFIVEQFADENEPRIIEYNFIDIYEQIIGEKLDEILLHKEAAKIVIPQLIEYAEKEIHSTLQCYFGNYINELIPKLEHV